MIKTKSTNFLILVSIFILSTIGIIYSFETSGKLQPLIEQIFFVCSGFFLLSIFAKINFEKYRQFSIFFLISSILVLILVLIPGIGAKINGARRWIRLGSITFQPAEYVKLALILFFAHWFENKEQNRILAFLLTISAIFILIMLQPDMGTGLIILAISLSMFIVSQGISLIKILTILPLIFLVVIIYIGTSNYRLSRVATFFNLGSDIKKESYHATQALISIGSGGLFGVGIGKSRQKYSYLPEAGTDSIFGIIAEETGFVGSMIIIFCYFVIFTESVKVFNLTKKIYPKFICFGIIIFFFLQTFINFSSMLALAPLTGVPLPLISSGGSALLVQFSALGILLNIKKHV